MTQTEKQVPFIEDSSIEWETVGEGITRKILGYDANLMIVKVKFEQGAIGTLHQHYHAQMTHIQGGAFEVEIGGVKKILKDGDGFYATPNVIHGVVCLEPGMLIDVFNPMREDFIK